MKTKPANLSVELGFLCLLALLWGSSYLFIKVAVSEIPPLTLIATRVSVAAVLLMAVVIWRGDTLPRDGRTWRALLVQSIFNSIGAWTLLAWGQQYVDSGLAGVLNSTSPLFVFLFTVLITRHESTDLRKLFGALLGLAGVVLIIGVDVLAGLGQQVAGQLAAVTSAAMYAAAAIYGRRFAHISAPVTAVGTILWGVAVLVPAALIWDRPWTLDPSATAIGAAVLLGLFCTGLALMIYFRLIQTLGSLGTASQAYLRAGVSVFLGIVFLGEEVTALVGAGLLAAIAGVAAINLPVRPNAKSQQMD